MTAFGDLLREVRRRAGLSLGELSRKSYINLIDLSDLERGEARPTLRQVNNLVYRLDCTSHEARVLRFVAGFPDDRTVAP